MAEARSFLDLLGDRNFQNLLAGFGARLDPEGVPGALGTSLIGYNKAVVGAERAARNEARQNTQTQMLQDIIDGFGELTPSGTPGPTKIEATDSGVKAEIDGPVAPIVQQQTPPSTTPTQAPAPTTPIAPATNVQPPGAPRSSAEDEQIRRLSPFLLALLGPQGR